MESDDFLSFQRTTDNKQRTKDKTMARTNFENLHVYQLSERLADEIWDVVIAWDYFAKETIGKQIVRSADSISANIAESHSRYHFKDKAKFGYYARGSFEETKSWLRKVIKRNLINDEVKAELVQKMETIGPKLNALINSYKQPK